MATARSVRTALAERQRRRRRVKAVIGALALGVVAALAVWRATTPSVSDRVTYWLARAQDCGRASLERGHQQQQLAPGETQRAVACFTAAYAACRPAKVSKDVYGVDTEDTYVFVIEPRAAGGGAVCDVGLHADFYRASGNYHGSSDAQCATVVIGDGALTFRGCGDFADILVP